MFALGGAAVAAIAFFYVSQSEKSPKQQTQITKE